MSGHKPRVADRVKAEVREKFEEQAAARSKVDASSIEAARKAMRYAKSSAIKEALLHRVGKGEPSPVTSAVDRRGDVFELAPEILTLCSGSLQPFDFTLTPDQHAELYQAGALFTHLYASMASGTHPPCLSDAQKLTALMLVLNLDPPVGP